MHRWHLRDAAHVETETSLGRRAADFPAGDIIPADQAEDELLAHLAAVDVDEYGPLAARGDELADPEPQPEREPAPVGDSVPPISDVVGSADSDVDDQEGDD